MFTSGASSRNNSIEKNSQFFTVTKTKNTTQEPKSNHYAFSASNLKQKINHQQTFITHKKSLGLNWNSQDQTFFNKIAKRGLTTSSQTGDDINFQNYDKHKTRQSQFVVDPKENKYGTCPVQTSHFPQLQQLASLEWPVPMAEYTTFANHPIFQQKESNPKDEYICKAMPHLQLSFDSKNLPLFQPSFFSAFSKPKMSDIQLAHLLIQD